MAQNPFSVWWAPNGKAHAGRRGGVAACGVQLQEDAAEWHAEEDNEASVNALCLNCRNKLRQPGPWTNMDGWVRPPLLLQVHVGNQTEASRFNELTWRRLVSLANGQRLTRDAVIQVAQHAIDASEDPARQHVAKALHIDALVPWAAMVGDGGGLTRLRISWRTMTVRLS
jgi:hypothetical protein